MRRIAIAALLAVLATPARAQDTISIRPTPRGAPVLQGLPVRQLPQDVADDVVRFFNGARTVRFSGLTRIPDGRGVDGDVAILGGPVTIGGRVTGSLLVVNGDLTLEPGAVVGGDVMVVGGVLEGASGARIAGEIRAYRDPLRYRRLGAEIAYAPQRQIRPSWLNAPDDDGPGNRSGMQAMGGIYNRVEGLPFVFGPDADVRVGRDARLQLEARGIFRTAGEFSLARGDFGFRTRAELVTGGRRSGFGIGVRAYDVVQSVEPWPLKGFEGGWATFLLHRDYRDYFRRRGGSAFATLRLSSELAVTAEGRDEKHLSVDARDPWTLFRGDEAWRPNPAISDGEYRVGTVAVRYDTRNDRSSPTDGLFLSGEFEHGRGTDLAACPSTLPCADLNAAIAEGPLTYERLFADLRGYTRLSPSGRLAVRLAGGGWLAGDPLPLQRRVSLGYPDPLPGYGFRQFACGGEGTPGTPALCDRVLVGQVEFRTHLGLDIGPDWSSSEWTDSETERYEPFHVSGPDLVVFADAGRAWRTGDGPGTIPSGKLPDLSTFRTDLGVGLDLGPIGFYLAKPLGRGAEDVTFSVRMGRRF